VHHLVRDILPLVWAQAPSLTCTIVGEGWQKGGIPGVDPRVEVIGSVDDLDALFDTVRLTVAPLRFGAGIKGKVLDSFAAGLTCVMTPIAAEGLPLTNRLQTLVAQDAPALAERILRFHGDQALNVRAGKEARQMTRREFCAERVSAALRDVLDGAPAGSLRADLKPASR
jgi:hypothetical protein